MSQLNVRRVLHTTLVLCLSAIYLTVLVVWIVTSPVSPSTSVSDDSDSVRNDSLGSPNNSAFKSTTVAQLLYRRRQLKNLVAKPSDTIATSEPVSSISSSSSPHTTLQDVFISVKTTHIFHKSRLNLILDTWFKLARNQTYFFTDAEEDEYSSRSGGHLVNTNCSVSHNRKALCCKMSVEYDSFIASNKKWWCHFDDDNYVNIPRLVKVLQRYNPLYDWYLGKPSIKQPLEIVDRDSKKKVSFWFATGGAGFCVSRALALKMIPIASDGKLISVGDKIRLPDDVTVGYIIEHLLAKNLTVVDEFHSHLEPMSMLLPNSLHQQVSFSYSGNNQNRNVLSVKKDKHLRRSDPTRFYTLHCLLFAQMCKF